MIRGEKVCLRPVKRTDLPLLQDRISDPDFQGLFNDFGLKRDRYLEQSFEHDGLLSSQYGSLIVTTLEGQFIGEVGYHTVRYGPNDGSLHYNIGISLAPEQRGKGYGVEAQQLLVRYLFQTYPIMRVEASTDVENIAEQRALVKAGFTREGVLRKAQWRSGQYHDLILYSKVRGE